MKNNFDFFFFFSANGELSCNFTIIFLVKDKPVFEIISVNFIHEIKTLNRLFISELFVSWHRNSFF